MQRWEYKILVLDFPAKGDSYWRDNPRDGRSTVDVLNGLGSDGWELVSVFAYSLFENASWSGQTSRVDYLFKRPIS